MSDLFRKLNTLVKARINDALSSSTQPRHRDNDPPSLGPEMDREIETLRERINAAIEYEDQLQAQVNALVSEVASYDHQADEAVAQGKEAQARHLIERMQWAQRRLEMARADLAQHQLVAQDLIQRVNLLEASVADARQTTDEQPDENALSDVVKGAQERIKGMGDLIKAREDLNDEQQPPADEKAVDDDLGQRRNRLSKR
jgi:phage shock protein A